MSFTIDDAIDMCRDRASVSALHHMMNTAHRFEKVAGWLEALRDASSTIQAADFKHEPYYPGDNIYDMRDKEHDTTIEQVCEILDKLAE